MERGQCKNKYPVSRSATHPYFSSFSFFLLPTLLVVLTVLHPPLSTSTLTCPPHTAAISSTLASLIRSSFRLCRSSPRLVASSFISSPPLSSSFLSSYSFSSSPLTLGVRTYSSHSLLRNMSAYSTRVIGAPNTLEHRVYIGKCFIPLSLSPPTHNSSLSARDST